MARVLRIPRHDDETSFVLVHVDSSAAKTTLHSLDVTLVGTEGSAPYVLRCKLRVQIGQARATLSRNSCIKLINIMSIVEQSKMQSLKAKSSPYNKEEWIVILESILVGKQVDGAHRELLVGVEVVASVEENSSIDITVRKRTEGITQRLGTFQLSYDEDQEIELFEWCGLAVESVSATANELTILESKFEQQKDIIGRLNTQLEELITAKNTHEAELLEKFRDLLNEKKSKIRDQQRLLATAKVDPKKVAEVKAARSGMGTRVPAQSRPGKRKSRRTGTDEQDEGEDEDNGFEKMDVDVDQVPTDSDQEDAQTPDASDTETADENDGDKVYAKTAAMVTEETGPARGKAGGRTSGKDNVGRKKSGEENPEGSAKKTPPRRELPFAKKHAPRATSHAQDAVVEAGEETASDDDDDDDDEL